MGARLSSILVVALLVSTVFGPALLASSADRAAATSDACTMVRHTELRTSSAVEAVNETGEAVSRVSNTEVRIRDTTGFVKLDAKNPNGYCVFQPDPCGVEARS